MPSGTVNSKYITIAWQQVSYRELSLTFLQRILLACHSFLYSYTKQTPNTEDVSTEFFIPILASALRGVIMHKMPVPSVRIFRSPKMLGFSLICLYIGCQSFRKFWLRESERFGGAVRCRALHHKGHNAHLLHVLLPQRRS